MEYNANANMSEQNEQNTEDSERVYAKWQALSYPHYERGVLWYAVTGLIAGLILIASFWTYNFLLAVVVLMVAIVMVIQGGTKPPTIEIEITAQGIRRGPRFFNFKSIDNFWIVYEPPVKSLHIIVPRSIFPTVHIPIEGQNPVELRNILKQFIKEDLTRESEPVFDTISRILKI
jgi:hypothetical protein